MGGERTKYGPQDPNTEFLGPGIDDPGRRGWDSPDREKQANVDTVAASGRVSRSDRLYRRFANRRNCLSRWRSSSTNG